MTHIQRSTFNSRKRVVSSITHFSVLIHQSHFSSITYQQFYFHYDDELADRLLGTIEVIADEIIVCIMYIKSVSMKKTTIDKIKAHLIKIATTKTKLGQ